MPEPRTVSHARATAERRAVQMFDAWRCDDTDGLLALIAESEDVGQELADLVFSLLYVGTQFIAAATDGQLDHYREQLLGAVLIAEASTEEDPDA